ncbi:hypothetical protein BGW36DRAFT_357336 [Talaromyces proteolyticus]|uniref:Uncharacterized protein n=1 Tax=Talaromyces proteolyticus TaxID=1131652 RepID=A0AAD4KWC3_9EURO|nr:uncharacterized protein BGW36DRAFT_357336 [Talaromyces proteolyticus]KAH8700683.1 hypothetical protein BGW36DRAFT_357336 [Talaromyces proteolyticus]
MSDTKPDVVHQGYVNGTAKPSFLSRVGAHFKKWWWVHVIILIICVLVVVLPLVYVGYPRIAQNDVNDSTLNVTQLVFSDPAPNTIHVNQTQVLGNKAIYHPKIFAFNASLGLAGAAAPVAYVMVPQIQAEDGAIINVDTTLQLYNLDATTEFTKAVLTSETFYLNIYGKPELKEMVLPTSQVTFNKTVPMKGLNGLKGFSLSDVRISLTASADGTNMNGTANIPNPGVVSVAMGNVTLPIFVNGAQIGTSYINDLVLVPGSNTYHVKSIIDQVQVIDLVLGSKAKYPSGVIPLDIIGNHSEYNGQEITYYSEALKSNTMSTTLNVTQVLDDSGLSAVASALASSGSS